MHNIRELIKLSTDFLTKRGCTDPRRSAEELLAAILKKKRMELYFDYDAPIEEKEITQYREWIKRRGDKEPLAYILGEVEFLNLKLQVTPAVLIPRQETEILASLILKELSEGPKELWDLCTGSGCLGLAVKKGCPNIIVRLSDVSKEALAVAQANATQNNLDVDCLEGDLFAPFAGKKADVIVCNPPYVTPEEYEELEDEVRAFEPRCALVGGLDFYRRLAADLPTYLHPNGKVFLEIGTGQGEPLMEIFDQSHWKQRRYEKDWAGHDRFFFLEYQETFH